ncbi:MAG: hypothetical protein R3B84_09075 [Zavarzinella sp.]
MKLLKIFVCMAISWLTATNVQAAPPVAVSNDSVFLTGQLAPAEKIMGQVKTLAKNLLDEKTLEMVMGELGQFDLKDQLPGFDPTKPIGVYAVVDAKIQQQDFSGSYVVFLLPVTDGKKVIEFLTQLGVEFKKAGDGWQLETEEEDFPPVMVKEANKHLYVSVGDKAALDEKKLLDPSKVFYPKETGLAYFRMNNAKLPKELMTGVKEQFQQIEEAFDAIGFPEELRKATVKLIEYLDAENVKQYTQSDFSALRLDLNEKNGELVIETVVQPKSGTQLASDYKERKTSTHEFAELGGKDAVARAYGKMPYFAPELRAFFKDLYNFAGPAISKTLSEEGAPETALKAVEEFFKNMSATAEMGNMDFAFALQGPNASKHYNIVGALRLANTDALVKALRAAAKEVPQEMLVLDAEKVGKYPVHHFIIPEEIPLEAQAIFGKEPKVAIMFTENGLYVSFGVDNKSVLEAASKLKAKPAPIFAMEMNTKAAVEFAKTAGAPPEMFKALEKVINNPDMQKITLFAVEIAGGEALTIRYRTNAAAFAVAGLGTYMAVERDVAPPPNLLPAQPVPVAPPPPPAKAVAPIKAPGF